MADKLGPYTLERRIGAGGMADVFLARGPAGVCVVKRPHAHLCGSAEFVRMFLDEASLLAQLSHPGIARVFDLGHQGNTYYLAMEYVPGFDLMTISLEYERQGEWIAPELAARVMSDAAAAMHYAHEAKAASGQPLGIIHRDLTPHNILVSTTGAVKLIDFGVAKAAQSMHRTQAGLVKGKYPYMAPEQVGGKAIDRRVDVYALGLVLYEMLANTRAIPGDTEVEQIDNARQSRIKPIEQVRPNVPEILRRILMGCLHPDPDGRYPTAEDLHNDLETYLRMERHNVGREDLLRLFRIVAADPTHQLPHAGLAGFGSNPELTPPGDLARKATEEVVFPYGAPVASDTLVPSASMVAHGDVPRPVPSPMPVPPSQPGLKPMPPPIALADAVSHPTDLSVPKATRQVPKAELNLQPGADTTPTDKPGASALLIGAAAVMLLAGVALTARVLMNPGPAIPPGVEKPAPAIVKPTEPVAEKPAAVVEKPAEPMVEKPTEPVAQEPSEPVVQKPEKPKHGGERPKDPKNPTEQPDRPVAAVAKTAITVKSPIEADVTLDGAPVGGEQVEVKPGKHTVVLKAKDTGFAHTVSRDLKAGEQWLVEPASGVLKIELVPFGTARVNGREVVSGFSAKTLTVWAGRYELEAENKEAGKSIKRPVEVKSGAEQTESFNFLAP